MKTRMYILVALLGCLFCSAEARAASPKADKTDSAIFDSLDAKTFTFEVSRALPQSGGSVALDPGRYSLRVENDRLKSSLPYYGRAYSLPYGGGEGLVFESKIKDYQITESKRGRKVVKFTTRTPEDSYTFTIDVYPNGSAYIVVKPNNKTLVSFNAQQRTVFDKQK